MDPNVRQATAGTRRPGWTTARWWRQPVGPIYLATLVLCIGKGAWFTCWAMFFTRLVGLSPAQFGIGVTAAGMGGVLAGWPLGYLADRLGARETLIGLGVVYGLAMYSLAFVRSFWAVVLVTCVLIAAERPAPSIRVALISGLTSGAERLRGISTTHVMGQAGLVLGSIVGAIVLSADDGSAYLMLNLFCGTTSIVFAGLLFRTPHVESLGDRKVSRKVLVLRDRPFLLITLLSGLLALNWGMLSSGLPLWINTHTRAPAWVMGVIFGLNAAVVVLFLNRVSRSGSTVRGAARLGLWAGVALAVSCLIFAASYHGSGPVVLIVLLCAAGVYALGELYYSGSGFGLSVGLTQDAAHGEYQSMFATGQSTAQMIAPGVMTLLLVGWGVAGWFALAALYLTGGLGIIAASRWAMRTPRRQAAEPASGSAGRPAATEVSQALGDDAADSRALR